MSRRVNVNSVPNKCACGAITINVIVGYGEPIVLCNACIREIYESSEEAKKNAV